MGYYTRFRLETEGADADELIRAWSQTNDHAEYCLSAEQESKWYEHEQDLRAFSLQYPEVTFILNGEGEESGDIWKLYAKNGVTRKVKAKIVFEEVAL